MPRSRISWCSRRSRNTPSRWACSRSTRPRSPACASSCRQRSRDGAKSWNRPESPARNETGRNAPPESGAPRDARGRSGPGHRNERAAPLRARGKGLLRPYRRPQGRRRRRRRGRDRGAHRRQRCRQVDADDDDFRQSARPRGPHHLRRPRHHAAAHARDRTAEDRAGARRSSYLRAHDCDGEPADGRRGRRRHALSVRRRPRVCIVSPPQGAHRPARRHALRRRTADAGDRARADGTPAPPPSRRAFARLGAAHRAPDLRRDQEAQHRRKAHCVPGGTERVPRLEACAPRLCHGQWPDHAQRNRARAAGAAGGEGGLSRGRQALTAMRISIPEFLSDEHSLAVFFLVSVAMGGGAAWLAGRAIASTWRPWWHLALYMLPLSAVVRFLHYALFDSKFLSLHYYLIDYAVCLAFGSLGFHLTRATQMVTRYKWIHERAGLFRWRRRDDTPAADTPKSE